MHARSLLAAVALIALFGCSPQNVTPKSSGSIAISHDDALLYVADADHDRLTVINSTTQQVVAQTPVGSRPERVLVGNDGAVYVTNRGSRSISRLTPDGLNVESTATVGAEPVGMALTPDGKRLLVANSMSGTVSVLDAKTLETKASLSTGGQPWAVTVLADGHQVYVTDFTGGSVKVADLNTGNVVQSVDLTQSGAAECPNAWSVPSRQPAQAADVILSPEGDRAYVAHVQSRTGGTFGAQNTLSFAVAPALSTVDTSSHTNHVEVQNNGIGDNPNGGWPAAMLATNLTQDCQTVAHGGGMDAPSSLVVDGMGQWIFVADHNSNAVAVVSSTRRNDAKFRIPERGIADVIGVGARPTGIAISGDLKHAYVHNALDYTVSVIANVNGKLTETATIPFSKSELAPDVERGRRLFYSSVDPRVTQPELGGVSCSSCHPEGRTDALTWVLPGTTPTDWWTAPNATDPRNTPVLWGVTHTAPYHWDGSSQDLSVFSTGMVNQMGGAGLDSRDVSDLSAFMATLQVPDNPALGTLAPGLVNRGQELFQSSCASCHSGQELTDGLKHATFDTPSLRGSFASAPYLHDGSAPTLRAVLTSYTAVNEHDQTRLSVQDLEALEAFVQVQ